MIMLFTKILAGFLLLMLSACSSVQKKTEPLSAHRDKVIVAKGYSQFLAKPRLPHVQNRYVTEQKAKLHAYRELARQLYSEKLTEGRRVADQVIKDDLYRTYLDMYLRGAEIVESTQIADQKKVVLSLRLTTHFYRCLSSSVPVVAQCVQQSNKTPFTRIGYKKASVKTVNLSCFDPGCAQQLSVSGFSKEKNSLDSTMLNYGFYDSGWMINVALRSALRYFALSEF